MIVYTYKKEKIVLADEPFAAGGEGEVRRVISCPSEYSNNCAKLYFKPKQTEDHEKKIRFMVENPPSNIVGDRMMLAWPIETIYAKKSGQFLGFLMPTAFPNSRKLVILTTLRIKKAHKTEWYKFDKERDKKDALVSRMKLINNIAIPLHLLHETNKYVLKDFKPDNVLVSPTGEVTIVDMDSIQICDSGKLLFPGTAATEEYVPPEFYNSGVGRDSSIPLSKSWDNFAVAVVFYQILFGLTPYALTPKTHTEDSNTIPYCISHNLFPFGKNASEIQMVPKPHYNFNVIPQPIKDLFIRAFGDSPEDRPQVMEWGKTINTVIRSIPNCPPPTPPQPPTPPIPSNPSKKCPQCGAVNEEKAICCNACGFSFKGKKRILRTIIIVSIIILSLIAGFLGYQIYEDNNVSNENDFYSYVDEYISGNIINQSMSSAWMAYNDLYQNITTDSKNEEESEECYFRAFMAIFSVFSNNANRVFASDTWNDDDLTNIKNTAQELLNRRGLQYETDSLNRYINYVDEYYMAIDFINESHNCTSANSYHNLVNKAKQYSGYPFKNNARLCNIVSDVSDNARVQWKKTIEADVDDFCTNLDYRCRLNFDAEKKYNEICNDIKEYEEVNQTTSWANKMREKTKNGYKLMNQF